MFNEAERAWNMVQELLMILQLFTGGWSIFWWSTSLISVIASGLEIVLTMLMFIIWSLTTSLRSEKKQARKNKSSVTKWDVYDQSPSIVFNLETCPWSSGLIQVPIESTPVLIHWLYLQGEKVGAKAHRVIKESASHTRSSKFFEEHQVDNKKTRSFVFVRNIGFSLSFTTIIINLNL